MSRRSSASDPVADDSGVQSATGDPRVVAAMHEYLAALESGDPPARKAFVAAHPQIAEELNRCLDGLELVHRAAMDLGQGTELRNYEFMAEPTQQALGDFRILREIGRGGMGIVYEATQLSLGRRVAVKVLPFAASLDPARLQRFKNEAQAAAQLHHSNIVPVYAVGAERGMHFYAMQLIEGQSLADLIRHLRQSKGRGGRAIAVPGTTDIKAAASSFPPPLVREKRDSKVSQLASPPALPAAQTEACAGASTIVSTMHTNPNQYFHAVARLMHQAAAALEHAHRFSIIHRDVKPANLLLDERGNLWVTDFGLAQFQVDVPLTRTGDMLGTLRYMSPEQIAGDRVVLDQRADIYSLGVTMYELLTLEPAVPGVDRHSLFRQILEDDPIAPRVHDARIPIELETIVLKAVAKAPAERYATAQQLADDLQRWLEDKPILARRPTLRERFGRWRRRHRALVNSAIVFLLLACCGLVASTSIVLREHGKTKRAYDSEVNQRVAAEESFRQARRVVDAFTQLGEDELASQPSLQPLRRRFLETSLEYYKAFLDQRRNDSSLQGELTAAAGRVSRIIDELSVLESFAPLLLLSDKHVQEDLSLSATQQQDVDKLWLELAQQDELSRDFDTLFGDETPQQQQQQQLANRVRADEQRFIKLLGQEKIQRLRQIEWQQRGPFAFKSPAVIAALELTADQRREIGTIIEEERPDKSGGPGPGRGPDDHGPGSTGGPGFDRGKGPSHGPGFGDGTPKDPPPMPKRGPGPHGRTDDDGGHGPPRGKGPKPWGGHHSDHQDGFPMRINGAMARTVERIFAVLSPPQQEKWKQLIGEPFVYDLHLRPDEWLPQLPNSRKPR